MGYHPRIEHPDIACFITTRSRCSELWFVNNPGLDQQILGYLAKYATRYGAKIYGFAIEGNHIQFPALFPNANRSGFMRDLNSSIARAVPRFQHEHPGGAFWARRYSSEPLPDDPDVEDRFFYTVLQAVNDGLVNDIRDYPGYNCFEDAINGRTKKFKMVNWKQYNDVRRWNPEVKIDDFIETFELTFDRLPGYETLSKEEYASLMREKLASRTKDAIAKRNSRHAVGREKLLKVKPGAKPKTTKTSTATDHRPRALSRDPNRRAAAEAWYFSVHFAHKRASKRYRAGKQNTRFPAGTYKPPVFTRPFSGKIPNLPGG